MSNSDDFVIRHRERTIREWRRLVYQADEMLGWTNQAKQGEQTMNCDKCKNYEPIPHGHIWEINNIYFMGKGRGEDYHMQMICECGATSKQNINRDVHELLQQNGLMKKAVKG